MDKQYNLPVALIAILFILLFLSCAFSPAIISFAIAGSQDGYTLEAFDFGPSPWWLIGIGTLCLAVVIILLVLLRILKAAP